MVTKCDACGIIDSELIQVRTTNGVLSLCDQCLGDINRKNPELKPLKDQIEQLRVQLAGILTAAEGATSDPATMGQYGWSYPYQAVLELRIRYDDLWSKHRDNVLYD